MSSNLKHNATLYIHIIPGSDYFPTLQTYLHCQGTHTRQLTDTEQARSDKMSGNSLLRYIGVYFKKTTLAALRMHWPEQSDVYDSMFKSIADHDEKRVGNRADRLRIPYEHPRLAGIGTTTDIHWTEPWQFAEPSEEAHLQEPNATLRIHVHPGGQEFSLFQRTLQQQGFSAPQQDVQTATSTAQRSDIVQAANEMYWDLDTAMGKKWPDLKDQVEIKRNIYHSIANYTEEDNLADDRTSKIELRYYHPRAEDLTLHLDHAAIPMRLGGDLSFV